MRHTGVIAGWTALALVLVPAAGEAQRPEPRFTIEAYGGVADYGRFLEQARLVGLAVDGEDPTTFLTRSERELTGETSLALGGSVGFWPWDKTSARLSFTWSPTELEFEDDTGTDVDVFDREELADLDVFVASAELVRFLFDEEDNWIAPYANAGIAAAWWNLDTDELLDTDPDLLTGGDDTQFRWGGVGGLGVQIRLTPRLATRLEVSTFGLGNPFDGDDAYRVTNPAWITFDEPNNVRMTRATLALTYTFWSDTAVSLLGRD